MVDQPIKDIFRFLAASLSIMLVAAALNYAVDPLQIFRAARWFPPVYSQDSRLQNAGLIRMSPMQLALEEYYLNLIGGRSAS